MVVWVIWFFDLRAAWVFARVVIKYYWIVSEIDFFLVGMGFDLADESVWVCLKKWEIIAPVIITINNEPITMPMIPPTGNDDEVLISLTVVNNLVVVVNRAVVFVVVGGGGREHVAFEVQTLKINWIGTRESGVVLVGFSKSRIVNAIA
jgi:hypothetical protein